jgi:hypothetical protein
VADPSIFQKARVQGGGGVVPQSFLVFKEGFHSQNALFLPFFFQNFLTDTPLLVPLMLVILINMRTNYVRLSGCAKKTANAEKTQSPAQSYRSLLSQNV